jgi:hypothetical protein
MGKSFVKVKSGLKIALEAQPGVSIGNQRHEISGKSLFLQPQ